MSWKDNLEWKIYLFIVTPFYLGSLAGIFDPNSPFYAYYHILIAFDTDYTLLYFLNIGSILMNALALVPLLFFTFHIYFLPARFWQWFLFLRLFFELTGHAYEINFIKSMMHANNIYSIPSFLFAILLILPSYIACFKYAFTTQEDLFRK